MGGSNKNEINAILNSVEVKVEVLDELGSESFSLWTEGRPKEWVQDDSSKKTDATSGHLFLPYIYC